MSKPTIKELEDLLGGKNFDLVIMPNGEIKAACKNCLKLKEKIDKEEKIGFIQGVVYSIAQLIRRGNLYLAEYLWTESGYKPDDVKVCSEEDVIELRKFISKFPKFPKGIE